MEGKKISEKWKGKKLRKTSPFFFAISITREGGVRKCAFQKQRKLQRGTFRLGIGSAESHALAGAPEDCIEPAAATFGDSEVAQRGRSRVMLPQEKEMRTY